MFGVRQRVERMKLGGLAAGLALAGCAALPSAQPPELTVGIISDVHLPFSGSERVRRAFALFDRRKVDAVLICGDLTHYGLVRELTCIRDLWDESFRGNRRSDGEPIVPLFIYGDHDTGGYMHEFDEGEPPCKFHGIDRETVRRELIKTVGSGTAWKRVFGEDWDCVQVKDVKGYRFILSHYYGTIHQLPPPNLAARFGEAVAGVPPDRPFFFVQHRVYPNTVEAHPWNTEWWCADCDSSNGLLREHGNAVAICGHAHSNLLNERNFWRGDFTAVEVPSLSELAYPRSLGIDREKTDETSVQCLIMNVWPHRVVFERLDARRAGKLARDWVVEL